MGAEPPPSRLVEVIEQRHTIVLLLAMIGAIVLTHVYRPTIKRQNINKQNMTFAKDRVELVKPKSGEGINSDD